MGTRTIYYTRVNLLSSDQCIQFEERYSVFAKEVTAYIFIRVFPMVHGPCTSLDQDTFRFVSFCIIHELMQSQFLSIKKRNVYLCLILFSSPVTSPLPSFQLYWRIKLRSLSVNIVHEFSIIYSSPPTSPPFLISLPLIHISLMHFHNHLLILLRHLSPVRYPYSQEKNSEQFRNLWSQISGKVLCSRIPLSPSPQHTQCPCNVCNNKGTVDFGFWLGG